MKNKDRMLAPIALLDLTNKFINDFFELAHAERVKIKEESNMPQLYSAKKDDSYEFNYALAECIINCDYVKKQTDYSHPLMDMGFVSNIVKGFFQNNIGGVVNDIKFILKNYLKQEPYFDYIIDKLGTQNSVVLVDSFSLNWKNKDDLNDFSVKPIKVEKKQTIHTFTLRNTRNTYQGVCEVKLLNNKIHSIVLFNYNKTEKQLIINEREEATIEHYKYVADINSFFMILDQVIYGIKETLKKENKRKEV